jgi:hypothetical protein
MMERMSMKDVYCELDIEAQTMVDNEIQRYETNIRSLLCLWNSGKSLDDFVCVDCPQEFNDMLCSLDDDDQYVLMSVFEDYEYKVREIKGRFANP